MKKNAISIHKSSYGSLTTYDFSNMRMTFCSAPDRKNTVKLINYFDSCRETVCHFLRAQVETNPCKFKLWKEGSKIDTKRTRLALYHKACNRCSEETAQKFAEEKDAEMAVGLKLVNHYERKFGWLITKINKIDYKTLNENTNSRERMRYIFYSGEYGDRTPNINIYIVVGSSKWLRSPHTLSLYLLLLRLGTRGVKGEFETHEEFLEEIKVFAGRASGSIDNPTCRDAGHVAKTYKMWDTLLENHSKLFAGKSIKRLYHKDYLVGKDGFNEGITNLCTGYSRDSELSKKFISLCKDSGINIKYKVNKKKFATNSEVENVVTES